MNIKSRYPGAGLFLFLALLFILFSMAAFGQTYTNFTRVASEQGYAVGAYGAETLVIDQNGLVVGGVPQFVIYQIEDLVADGDIETRPLFVCPAGYKITLTAVKIISQGTPIGIDADNTCVIEIFNDVNSIVSKTYKDDPAFPDGVVDDLGALSDTHKVVAAGKVINFSVTNETDANPPAFILQIEGILEKVP